MTCSIGRAMEILGERWTFLILRESFYGVRRFSDIQRNLGIARNILSTRLQTLVGAGILERVLYQEEPERYEYRLSEAGKRPLSGDRDPDALGRPPPARTRHGPPVVLRHNACGHEADPLLVCSHCREELDPHEVTPERSASEARRRSRRDEPSVRGAPKWGPFTPHSPEVSS